MVHPGGIGQQDQDVRIFRIFDRQLSNKFRAFRDCTESP
jgi:hypothetical protein